MLYIITDYLATHGLEWQFDGSLKEDDDIQQPDNNNLIRGFSMLDIRDRLVDGPNHPYIYSRLVGDAISIIQKHGKVVICCSAGISRSNSIAVGVLMRWQQMDFDSAVEMVKAKVPIVNMKACHLEHIKAL